MVIVYDYLIRVNQYILKVFKHKWVLLLNLISYIFNINSIRITACTIKMGGFRGRVIDYFLLASSSADYSSVSSK